MTMCKTGSILVIFMLCLLNETDTIIISSAYDVLNNCCLLWHFPFWNIFFRFIDGQISLLSYTSTCEIPNLLYTLSLTKVSLSQLSSLVSQYRALTGVPLGIKATFVFLLSSGWDSSHISRLPPALISPVPWAPASNHTLG